VPSDLYTGVVILSVADAGSMNPHAAVAEFVATGSQPTCPGGTASGNCCYQLSPSKSPTSSLNAGLLTLDDASASIGTLGFSGSSYALSSTSAVLTWKAGDTLTVSGAGAAVDAFSASAVAPSAVSGLSPAITGDQLLISNTSDWKLSWIPDPAGLGNEKVVVTLTDHVSGAEVSCGASDSAGVVTVPAALLGNFKGGFTARVEVDRNSETIAQAANALVDFQPTIQQDGMATFSDGPVASFAGAVTMTVTGSGASQSFSVTAEFVPDVDAGTCADDCCAVSASGATASGSFNAGEITIQDSTPTIGILSFSDRTYTLSTSPTILRWQGGDTLGVSAFGGVVLPFSAVVTVPSAILGLNPSLADGPVAIATDSAWTLSWTPDSLDLKADDWESEAMRMVLTDGDAGQVLCNVADSVGTLTLPAALLAGLRSGDTVTIAVDRRITTSVSDSSGAPPVTSEISAVATLNGSATLK
jgi:hypothetical protein